jgi:PAS domain S-box-containing protein
VTTPRERGSDPAGAQPRLLLERLIAVSMDGMLAFDRQHRCLVWSSAMERITGLRATDVIGRRVLEVLPFLEELGGDALLREALEGRPGRSDERPFHVVTSGHRGHYHAEYWPWFADGDGGREVGADAGAVAGGIVVLRDVTEARHTEQQIRETEARFKNMADAAPVLLWMSRTDGLCTFFNQTWLNFTGRSLSEEWGVGWAEGVHFEDFQRCMDTYIDAFNQRQVFEMEYRLRRRDGEFRWILDRGTPRYTPDGTFAGYIGSCVDITERKQLEVDLRQAVRVRDEFLSIASHELRTPLTSLQLRVESLLRRVQDRPDEALSSGRLVRDAAVALDQILHLGNMVNVLLDVSRIGEGRLAFEYQEVDVAALVGEVIERLKGPAADAGCDIRLQTHELPRARWDRFRIEQVVTNLLANAIKYGAGQPVDVALTRAGDRARLVVVDRGPGIAHEHQAQLFERFARFAPARHYGGFGLGLWISREIVRAHGGEIGVRSSPGGGAAFDVELPLTAPEGGG